MELEQLRRDCSEWEFRHSHPGRCSLCQEYVATTLDRHMINVHLELGQLWRCPVEWCTVWKGSLCDCLSHLHEKHGGSQYVAMNNLGKFYPRGLCPKTFGWRMCARMCLVWRWTPSCSMISDTGWYTDTRYAMTFSLIRRCGGW